MLLKSLDNRQINRINIESLFKEDDHVVVDIEANVAVCLVLDGEAAT